MLPSTRLHIGIFSLLLLFLAVPCYATDPTPQPNGLVVFSISPSQAEPGTIVSINGSGFRDDTKVWLGGTPIRFRLVNPSHLELIIPQQTAPGQYSLAIRNAKGGRSYAIQVLNLRPVASGIEPDRVTPCGTVSQEITVHGANFSPDSQLLLDGAIIRSRFVSPETLTFTIPPSLAGGMHQVTVKRGDQTATPLALAIVTRPEIQSVTVGESQLNSYQLIINGSNFSPQSNLLVDGSPVATSALQQKDRLIYEECTRLVYHRQPTTSTPRTIRLQITNPNGEYSQPFETSAP